MAWRDAWRKSVAGGKDGTQQLSELFVSDGSCSGEELRAGTEAANSAWAQLVG